MVEITLDDIQENIAIIKINKSYRKDMSALELYDVTRGCWKRKLNSVQIADYVLAVAFGEVVEVYHADKWVPASELNRETIPFDAELEKGRIGFIGSVADDGIRNKYIGKSVSNLYKWGEADPVKVIVPDEWFPSDYTPGFTVEQWAQMLQDKSLFYDSNLQMMKRMKDIGGQATCLQLVNKYGESVGFYISGTSSLAKRIVDRTGCPVLEKDNENAKRWPVLFLGKYASQDTEGGYIWKLRPELSDALDRVDLSSVELYAKNKVDNINNAMPPASISETTVVCPRCSYEFQRAERCPECGQLILYKEKWNKKKLESLEEWEMNASLDGIDTSEVGAFVRELASVDCLSYHIGAVDLSLDITDTNGKKVMQVMMFIGKGISCVIQPSGLMYYAEKNGLDKEPVYSFLESMKSYLSKNQKSRPYERFNGYYDIEYKTLLENKSEIKGLIIKLKDSLLG